METLEKFWNIFKAKPILKIPEQPLHNQQLFVQSLQ